ncbi:MAG TPA: energy transducer TonB [Candidatus Angelobacter sp.]|nr:energy transducer TonB [Candidatus Angelobacter sp.]
MLKGHATIVGLLLILGTTALAQEPRLKWVSRIEPVYPQMAKIAHIQGDVWIELELDPQGAIVSLLPLSGHPILIQAASDSLRKSKFACENCSEESTFFSVAIRFKMDDPPKPVPQPGPVADASRSAPKRRSARCLYLWRCAAR